MQHRLLKELQADKRFIVCLSDKNLGPCIIKREAYIKKAFDDHLGNTDTYQRLPQAEATERMNTTETELKALVKEHSDKLTTAEQVYFERSHKKAHRIPLFYLTFKVHK